MSSGFWLLVCGTNLHTMDHGFGEGGGDWENIEQIQMSDDTQGKGIDTCMPKMREISKAPIGG